MHDETTARRKDAHLDLCATEEVAPVENATLLGDVGPFLRVVGVSSLIDLTIEPASLEEAFLDFYATSTDTESTR